MSCFGVICHACMPWSAEALLKGSCGNENLLKVNPADILIWNYGLMCKIWAFIYCLAHYKFYFNDKVYSSNILSYESLISRTSLHIWQSNCKDFASKTKNHDSWSILPLEAVSVRNKLCRSCLSGELITVCISVLVETTMNEWALTIMPLKPNQKTIIGRLMCV